MEGRFFRFIAVERARKLPMTQRSPGEWDAFMDDVAQTLDKFAVPPGERAEVVAIAESTRADIVV